MWKPGQAGGSRCSRAARFEISAGMRAAAIALGAILTSRRGEVWTDLARPATIRRSRQNIFKKSEVLHIRGSGRGVNPTTSQRADHRKRSRQDPKDQTLKRRKP